MRRLITAKSVLLESRPFETAPPTGTAAPPDGVAILMDDDRIVAITSRHDAPEHDEHLDFADSAVCPAYLDVHVHGGLGHDVMEASPAALGTISSFLASRGVAGYLATTVTAPVDTILRSLAGLSAILQRPPSHAAVPLGIHLEGPFLSHEKRGVHPPGDLQKPSIALFHRFWEASQGTIRLMTVAPEVEGATGEADEGMALIEHATRLGVRISLGHSNADAATTQRAIAAGAVSATHTFNAMRPLDHRDPGILGTVLDTASMYAELICDGIHVDPALVRLFWKAKGPDHAILVTDGISATGMPDGEYLLGGLVVQVSHGRCMHQGRLAGSVLTLDQAVRNFMQFTGASVDQVIRLVTQNPAAMIGAAAGYGRLAVGLAANLNVLRQDGTIAATYLQGQRVV